MSTATTNNAHETLPHASSFVPDWSERWERTGRLVLLLDFDGTLAPIVARPEIASIVPAARGAIVKLLHAGAEVGVISGRGLDDVRMRLEIRRIVYAGNHGMEIDGPGIHRTHPEAAAARPALDRAAAELRRRLDPIDGAIVEDKGLTLSIHYRLVTDDRIGILRAEVGRVVGADPDLRVTEGKMVLEIRPRVDWDKGRAVLFLLDNLQPEPGVPVVYIGDDVTDEDAFRVLAGRGEAVVVAETIPAATAATSYVRSPREVADLLEALARRSPEGVPGNARPFAGGARTVPQTGAE